MSIYTALRAGVSGLTANSSALATISDNIANVNTVGYKRSGVEFSALVNAQNSATTYNAGGVLPLTRQQISLQGSLEQSRSTTDLAISGVVPAGLAREQRRHGGFLANIAVRNRADQHRRRRRFG
jgi:flagellar hook protein FlgE